MLQAQPWLERAAALHPDRVAVEAHDGTLTYAELLARARAVGCARGDVMAIEEPPGLAFAVALHACALVGAVALPVDPRLGATARAQIRAARPSPDSARPSYAPLGLDDPLLLVHTSGTTGAPRPVTLTHGNVEAQALATGAALGIDPAERWLCPLPLAHVGGLMVLLRSVIWATTAVLRRVEGADLHGATLASLVPTQLARALDAGLARPVGLRAVLLGGAGAPRPLLERAAAAGVPVAQTYGLTQACSAVTISAPGDLETQGPPLPGVAVSIAADGEICLGGPTVAGGGGGPLATGDLGELDAAGRLRVVGRKADTIVTGGENVAPTRVEAVLLAHPAVADVGVFGRPDPEWGEAVHAQVVLRPEASVTAEALRAFARGRLAGHEAPKAVELVDELPRTPSGKLLRRALG